MRVRVEKVCSKNFDGERLWAPKGTRKDDEQRWAWKKVSTDGRNTSEFVVDAFIASASLRVQALPRAGQEENLLYTFYRGDKNDGFGSYETRPECERSDALI